MSRRHPLNRYLHTPLPPETADASWNKISQALPKAKRRYRMAPLLAAACMLAAIATFAFALWRQPWEPNVIDGALLETDEGEQQALELADGSRLLLGSLTRLRFVQVSGVNVRLQLEAGTLDAAVTHVAGRTFRVTAGDVEVVVVGTQFHVGHTPSDGQVNVSVSEGRVQLVRAGEKNGPRFLSAGEEWSTRLPPAVAAAVSATVSPPQQAPRKLPKPATGGAPLKGVLPPRFYELQQLGRYPEAYAEISADLPRLIPLLGPRDLYAVALVARTSAHPTQAALAFDTLRKGYRKDQRAALAARELGTMRLNELEDPAGAREAFEDAILLNPSTFFREDTEARRIQALDVLGARDECVESRDKYLETYPDSIHAAGVRRRCN